LKVVGVFCAFFQKPLPVALSGFCPAHRTPIYSNTVCRLSDVAVILPLLLLMLPLLP
jgi:hypothetical protein